MEFHNEDDPAVCDRWLNAKEAAQYLGKSAWSIRRLAAEGSIRYVRLPGRASHYRFKQSWLDDFIEAQAAEKRTKLQPPPKPKLRQVKSPQERVAAVRAKLKEMKG